jgi:hypothetical protein
VFYPSLRDGRFILRLPGDEHLALFDPGAAAELAGRKALHFSEERCRRVEVRPAYDSGSQRETEFREEQEAFPSAPWERGNKRHLFSLPDATAR